MNFDEVANKYPLGSSVYYNFVYKQYPGPVDLSWKMANYYIATIDGKYFKLVIDEGIVKYYLLNNEKVSLILENKNRAIDPDRIEIFTREEIMNHLLSVFKGKAVGNRLPPSLL